MDSQQKFSRVHKRRFQNLKWSPDERLFRERNEVVNEFPAKEVPFSLVAQDKFKRSIFGPFLHTFNKQQTQCPFLNETKLSILKYDMSSYSPQETAEYEANNNFADNLLKLLQQAVGELNVINEDFLYANIFGLRITDTPLTLIDSHLKKFVNLKLLLLGGNWLSDICGECLPRTLEYLELFTNRIDNVASFSRRVPKRLVHVGLKRNKLSDDSQLHLFAAPGKFNYLRSLDLSDNDIYDLKAVLDALETCSSLFTLQLEGNPCSVIASYKNSVLAKLKRLVFLDNVEITKYDWDDGGEYDDYAAVTFTCHRIMGLPPPPKESDVTHQFYMEVSMPLLEEVIVEEETLREEYVAPPSAVSAKKSEKSQKSAKKGKKKVAMAESPYGAADEYETERRRRVTSTSFKTERFEWARIMQLPEEALVVQSRDGNLCDIRNTFRSSVNVKLIYLKIRRPHTGKAKKAKGKSKKLSEPVPDDEGKEVILKKITLADFWCDLHAINWSDKTIDFYWAQHPKTTPNAIEMEGSLRAVNYKDQSGEKKAEKKGKKEKRKSEGTSESDGKKTSKTDGQSEPYAPTYEAIPKILTCQVGFGLIRSHNQDNFLTFVENPV